MHGPRSAFTVRKLHKSVPINSIRCTSRTGWYIDDVEPEDEELLETIDQIEEGAAPLLKVVSVTTEDGPKFLLDPIMDSRKNGYTFFAYRHLRISFVPITVLRPDSDKISPELKREITRWSNSFRLRTQLEAVRRPTRTIRDAIRMLGDEPDDFPEPPEPIADEEEDW